MTIPWTDTFLDTIYPAQIVNAVWTEDSPAQEADPSSEFQSISDSDSFTMWLMFQPIDGQWVPLRKVNWSWSATAALSGTNWVLTNATNTANPLDIDSTDYPQWSDNATNHLNPL